MHNDDRITVTLPADVLNQVLGRAGLSSAMPAPGMTGATGGAGAGSFDKDDRQALIDAANALLPRRARGTAGGGMPTDPDIARIVALGDALIPRRARK